MCTRGLRDRGQALQLGVNKHLQSTPCYQAHLFTQDSPPGAAPYQFRVGGGTLGSLLTPRASGSLLCVLHQQGGAARGHSPWTTGTRYLLTVDTTQPAPWSPTPRCRRTLFLAGWLSHLSVAPGLDAVTRALLGSSDSCRPALEGLELSQEPQALAFGCC